MQLLYIVQSVTNSIAYLMSISNIAPMSVWSVESIDRPGAKWKLPPSRIVFSWLIKSWLGILKSMRKDGKSVSTRVCDDGNGSA